MFNKRPLTVAEIAIRELVDFAGIDLSRNKARELLNVWQHNRVLTEEERNHIVNHFPVKVDA